jgi:ribose transport system ATP-binding protein
VEASVGAARLPEAGAAALRLWDLSKTFGGQKALDKASLEVAPGEVHGLLGQNGSGKSTLIKVLAGFMRRIWEAALRLAAQRLRCRSRRASSENIVLASCTSIWG